MGIGESALVLGVLMAVCLPQDYELGKPSWDFPIPVMDGDSWFVVGEPRTKANRDTSAKRSSYKVNFRLSSEHGTWTGTGRVCRSGEATWHELFRENESSLCEARLSSRMVEVTISQIDDPPQAFEGGARQPKRRVLVSAVIDGPASTSRSDPYAVVKLRTYATDETAFIGETGKLYMIGNLPGYELGACLEVTVEECSQEDCKRGSSLQVGATIIVGNSVSGPRGLQRPPSKSKEDTRGESVPQVKMLNDKMAVDVRANPPTCEAPMPSMQSGSLDDWRRYAKSMRVAAKEPAFKVRPSHVDYRVFESSPGGGGLLSVGPTEEVQAYDAHYVVRSRNGTCQTFSSKHLNGETTWLTVADNHEEFEPGWRIGRRWSRLQYWGCFKADCLEATIKGDRSDSAPSRVTGGTQTVEYVVTVSGRATDSERSLLQPSRLTPHRIEGKATLGETKSYVLSKDEHGEPEAWLEVTIEDAGVEEKPTNPTTSAPPGTVVRLGKKDAYGLQLRLVHQRDDRQETVLTRSVSLQEDKTASVDLAEEIHFFFRRGFHDCDLPSPRAAIDVTLREIGNTPNLKVLRHLKRPGPHVEIDLNVDYLDLLAITQFREQLSLSRTVSGKLTLLEPRTFVLKRDGKGQPVVWIEATLLELPVPEDPPQIQTETIPIIF